MVQNWIKDMVNDCLPKSDTVNGITYEKITEPQKGEIVYFKPFMNNGNYNIGDFYKVEIISGQYWGTHGLSNFWYWYRLDENNNRVRKESGYGCFLKLQ